MARPPTSLQSLPEELIEQIFSYLPKSTLLKCRNVNRHFEFLATPGAFRKIYVVAYGPSPERLRSIATSRLAHYVRDLTCDTWVRTFKYRISAPVYHHPQDFLDALSYISKFRNLRALHICFHKDCVRYTVDPWLRGESTVVRKDILETIMSQVRGIKTIEQPNSHSMMAVAQRGETAASPKGCYHQMIPLKTLTISNLSACDFDWMKTSSKIKAVLKNGNLEDLRLRIATEPVTIETNGYVLDRTHPKYPDQREKSRFFDLLPTMMLSPSTTKNLTVLALHCHEYWGWAPKLDLRRLSLPKIKVLSLSRYVFSHNWQVDWVASLGLEELYLDECAVLVQAHIHKLQMGVGASVIGKDKDGQEIKVSNRGYLCDNWLPQPTPEKDMYRTVYYPLRWELIFDRWRETMPDTLRVFKTGSGYVERTPDKARPRSDNYYPYFDSLDHDKRGTAKMYRYSTGIRDFHDRPLFRYLYWEVVESRSWRRWATANEFMDWGPWTDKVLEWNLADAQWNKDEEARDRLIKQVKSAKTETTDD